MNGNEEKVFFEEGGFKKLLKAQTPPQDEIDPHGNPRPAGGLVQGCDNSISAKVKTVAPVVPPQDDLVAPPKDPPTDKKHKGKKTPLILGLLIISGVLLALLLMRPRNQDPSLDPQEPTASHMDAQSPTESRWSDWREALPSYVTPEYFTIESETLYSSRQLETTTSFDSNIMEGWELFHVAQDAGVYGPWSPWSRTPINASDTTEVESAQLYRYTDEEVTTSTSPSLPGWDLYDTTYTLAENGDWSEWSEERQPETEGVMEKSKKEYQYRDIYYTTVYSDFSDFSEPQSNPVEETDLVDVEPVTMYEYSFFVCPVCNAHWHGHSFTCKPEYGGCGLAEIPESSWTVIVGKTPHEDLDWHEWYEENHYYAYYEGNLIFRNVYGDVTTTWYKYRTRTASSVPNETDWSPWSEVEYFDSPEREVNARILYSYCDCIEVPIYHFSRLGAYSSWSQEIPQEAENRTVEENTFYRSRTKVDKATYFFCRWTDWSEFSATPIEGFDTVQVQTKTMYRFKPIE